jgi:hypothetical protein
VDLQVLLTTEVLVLARTIAAQRPADQVCNSAESLPQAELSVDHRPNSRHMSQASAVSLGDHPQFLRTTTAHTPGCLLWPTKRGFPLTAGHPGTDLQQPEYVMVACAALRTGARQAPRTAHHGTHRSRSRVPGLELPTPRVGSAWQQRVQRRICHSSHTGW